MNTKCFVKLILILTLPIVLGKFAMGSSTMREPFSTHMKRAELIFIGTLVDKQYAKNEASIGFVTDLTFKVDKLIEGTPNIDKDTVIFCIPGGEGTDPKTGKHLNHWSSMGQEFAHLEVGDNVILFMQYNTHIAKWMPRRGGLYPVHSWTVKTKKVDGKEEYFVYFWSNSVEDKVKHHFLGIPLPLVIRFVEAARSHPDTIDPVTDIMAETMMTGITGGVSPNTPAAERITASVIGQIKQVLAELEPVQPKEGIE